jgi:hypothetical protein
MTRRKKITEKMVEGIYTQNQHKIETIPGYAEGFKRVYDLMEKSMDGKPGEEDQKQLQQALAELYMIEVYGWRP